MRPSLLSQTVRWVGCLLACACLAQRVPSSDFRKLSPEDATAFLGGFRNARLSGDLCLRFEVIHKPRTGDASPAVKGTLWARSIPGGQVLRGELTDAAGASSLRFVTTKNGAERKVWISLPGAPPKELDDKSPLQALAPGLLLSPFDLQLPFTHWPATEYVTTERRRRPANIYLAAHPSGGLPAKVSYAIDRVYGVLVEAICYDAQGAKTRTMQVEEFSKVGEQWMLAACSVRDEATRDVDLLRITEAALDARLSAETFEPRTLDRAAPLPADFRKL